MDVARGLADLPQSSEPVFVVVGVFDGLHLGHQYLLDHLVAEAAARSARPVVITFDHHPDEVITGQAPPLLCDAHDRLERLRAAGVAATVVVHFDQRLRETTYQGFVASIRERAPIAGFLMTPDAAFGYRREGTPAALAALGAEQGFDVVVVPPFTLDGGTVRSTEVRAAIAGGDLEGARALLGRPHTVVGVVGAEEDGEHVVAFPLPVMLPPDGSWPAAIDAGSREHRIEVLIDGGRLLVPPLPTGSRVRVRFGD